MRLVLRAACGVLTRSRRGSRGNDNTWIPIAGDGHDRPLQWL